MAAVSATVLSWIKTEVDHTLKVVRDSIARFSAAPEDIAALRVCPDQLHQVSAALRIVGLSGATRFCEAIEGTFSAKNGTLDKPAVGIIDHAVLALKEFVDDLARGQANVPLRLFSAYRELKTLQGKPDPSETDLFFPDLSLPAPAHPSPRALGRGGYDAFVQAQRAQFQRGLLSWLRNQPTGLHEMHQALDALHQIAGELPEPRALWWAGCGLLEGLAGVPDPEWAATARALCNKLDFRMRDLDSTAPTTLAPGSRTAAGEALMREILYAVAKCKPANTRRIKEIRRLYQLDSLFPEPPEAPGLMMEFDLDWLQPALADVRSRLQALEAEWARYVSGESGGITPFRERVGSFKTKAKELGSQHLVRLLDVMSTVINRLPDVYPRDKQFMVIEMASAFLLVETVIETFTNPPADLEQQIVIMGGWLLDAASGKSTGKPPAGLRADLTQQIGALQLRAQVAKEILANLQHVEQVLDAFARDLSKRDTLTGLAPYLRQIHGALFVLRFERATEVLDVCVRMIAECTKEAPVVDFARELDWIAEGLSSLGFYLDPCLHGREPADHSLTLFFDRYNKLKAPPEAPVIGHGPVAPAEETQLIITSIERSQIRGAQPPVDMLSTTIQPRAVAAELEQGAAAKSAPPAPAAAPVNDELLTIFLVEALDVLGNIDSATPLCRERPDNREALGTIRRSFHTLKGSGRMVGLNDLGEIAWEIEQVLNRYVKQNLAPTPDLFELITTASAAFAGWVAHLQAGTPLDLDARRIVELARRLQVEEAPVVTPPQAAPAAAAPIELPALEPLAQEPQALELSAVEVPVLQPPAPDPPAIELQEPAPEPVAIEVAALEQLQVPAPESDEVSIGSVRLTRSLFEVYLKEAQQHAVTLEDEFDRWHGTSGHQASHEFLRAAHTLASSSRTAGFSAIADLAAAIEHWLPFARQVALAADARTIQGVIGKVRGMVAAVAYGHAPGAADEAIRRLNDLTARLQATPPPPVTSVPRLVAAPVIPEPTGAPRPVPAGSELRAMFDDIDEQLLPIFLEEAQELLLAIGGDLREWKAKPAERESSQSLQRALHTFKGSARMAGAMRLGELAHLMETRVEAAVHAGELPAELFEDLESKLDRLSSDIERMLSAPGTRPSTSAAPLDAATPASGREPAPPAPLLAAPASLLRINTDTLDDLINESGEVSIARSRMEAELRLVKQSLGELNESIARLRRQLREVEVQADSQMQSRLSLMDERNREFDPLEFDRYTRLQELTRMMAESLHDASSIQQSLLKNISETDAALLHQARISRDLQQELMRMRAVPFANMDERLHRIVRQAARELDKRAQLAIEGSHVELDRSVFDRIGAPLEHMLRNALAHGIEPPARRTAAGKPGAGRITITLRQEGNEIALILSDDGAGLDLDRLERKALDAGILQPGQPVSADELARLIFASGISTAETVTELSGRGVGMDVVRSEIEAVGGRIDIATERDKGTTFTLYLPLTLAVTQAVMVRAAGSVVAVPAAMVEHVLRLKADAMSSAHESKAVESQDRSHPLHYLQHLLGAPGAVGIQKYNSVLLLRSGIQRIALHVDELIGNQEIVVKNVGAQLVRVPGIAGATVLADGKIALIVNPVQLAQLGRGTIARAAAPIAPAPKAVAPVVMVVDDSLTVRKITSRLLEREGYQVLTAKDGVDALEQMKETLPDIMLVDIEMPRMDGFELTKSLRGDPRTIRIPIIIISSRTAERHRNQATLLGANGFLGKPYQEAELLKHVESYLGTRKTGASLPLGALRRA